MNSKLYVGNLSFNVNEGELDELFQQFGEVVSVKIISDRATGKSRGFAFVEMENSKNAQEALDGLNGKEAFGRSLKVSMAKDRPRSSTSSPHTHSDRPPFPMGQGSHGDQQRSYSY